MTLEPTTVEVPSDIDPMMALIAHTIVMHPEMQKREDLSDFRPDNVIVIPPEEVQASIDQKVQRAISNTNGITLLLIAGSGSNPFPEAPGPLITVQLELQLYTSSKIRPEGSRPALALVVALARALHDARIQVKGFSWYEEIHFLGYDPLPDDAYTAYSLTFERMMSL